MSMSRGKPTRREALRIGDRVRFSLGRREFSGTIVENRGPIGAGGRQLYVVRAQIDLSGESMLELPADDLQAA